MTQGIHWCHWLFIARTTGCLATSFLHSNKPMTLPMNKGWWASCPLESWTRRVNSNDTYPSKTGYKESIGVIGLLLRISGCLETSPLHRKRLRFATKPEREHPRYPILTWSPDVWRGGGGALHSGTHPTLSDLVMQLDTDHMWWPGDYINSHVQCQ